MDATLHPAVDRREAARPGVPAGWERVAPDDELPVGAHLMTPRRGFTHHGIYVGGGRVVHYAGLSRTLFRGPVEEVTLARFSGGRAIYLRQGGDAHFAPADIVRRARSRLGEDLYRVASNNCEHFCEWCRSGESRSAQIDRLLRPLRAAKKTVQRAVQSLRGAPAAPSLTSC